MRDFLPKYYTFMRDILPSHYTFMRDFLPCHHTFMRDFLRGTAANCPVLSSKKCIFATEIVEIQMFVKRWLFLHILSMVLLGNLLCLR